MTADPERVKIPFGKTNKGKIIAELKDYSIQWYLEQEWIEEEFPKIYEALEEEKQRRIRSYIWME